LLVYQSTKSRFLGDVESRGIEYDIARAYLDRTGRYALDAEQRAWRHSLLAMAKVLDRDDIADNAGIAVEFGIPQTAKRIDFLISGIGADGSRNVVIIELKQWSTSKLSDKDGILIANRGGRSETEGPHPSYQAWSYAALLNGFNEAVYDGGIALGPCAYLHNYIPDDCIADDRYAPYIERAPVFLRGEDERVKLAEFIKRHIHKGDDAALLFEIEAGRIRPSKMLADSIVGMLKGNPEFVLVDEQKTVFETALAAARKASAKRKQVVIVRGGPGTGKSVVAIHLLAGLTRDGVLARYVSRNAAPREVYKERLAGHLRKVEIANLFGGSGTYVDTPPGTFGTLIVDEAHRLNLKSGFMQNLGENQIVELIRSADCTIFFVDDDQIVTLADIGTADALEQVATDAGATITHLELASQFRCSGSDGYLAWLDDVLGIRETANPLLDPAEFDFRIIDSPTQLHALIDERNRERNRARVVAGYCWDWASKKNPDAYDIELPEFGYQRQWNLTQDGSLWLVSPRSVEQVGCIHTCQGLELDYVGIIIGPDLVFIDDAVQTAPLARSSQDKTLRGYRGRWRTDPAMCERADRIVRNTYRTLMTRGMLGCYVYCCDPTLAEYLRSRIRHSDV
jgi:DUF2075 family protein